MFEANDRGHRLGRGAAFAMALVVAFAVAMGTGCRRAATRGAASQPEAVAPGLPDPAGAARADRAPGANAGAALAGGAPRAPARPHREPSPETDPPGTYMGRKLAEPMSYRGADWLDRGDRDATQKPEHVLDVVGVREGMTVADVGAGSGYFTVRLARRVGPRGRVLATDLQPEMLDLLRAKVSAARLTNVLPILATAAETNLPRGEVDRVLMVDVYHELPHPAATLAQIRSALRAGGRLALVEYRGEDAKVAIKPEHKMTLSQIKRELAANGFVLDSSDESLPEQRIVLFTPAS